LTKFVPAGGDGRGISASAKATARPRRSASREGGPARRAGATAVTSALGAERRGPRRADFARWGARGWGNPSTGPGPRQLTFVVLMILLLPVLGDAQTLSGAALVKSLQGGGYVIVMRHASSPSEVPEKPNPDNVPPERQLDAQGRDTSTAMGETLRRLKIPIGEVLTSPTYRARETARLARLPNPRPATELGEGRGTMQAVSAAQTEWLQKKVKEFPRGTNSVLITHVPNITAAFPAETPALAQGEALVFAPDGKGGVRVIGRIKIEEWPGL
jgi:phosphohistidine phosphatase SixA